MEYDAVVAHMRETVTGHWLLTVHSADVGHFVPRGGPIDREARDRGTSVYLPQHVIPMFPEIISNGLASLQQGKLRFVKSAIMDLTPMGQKTHVRFANAVIKTRRRFTYEEVSAILAAEEGKAPDMPPPV